MQFLYLKSGRGVVFIPGSGLRINVRWQRTEENTSKLFSPVCVAREREFFDRLCLSWLIFKGEQKPVFLIAGSCAVVLYCNF
jgi:hypothetical protein